MYRLPILGNYYLKKKIADGGNGKVYKVYDADKNIDVAFKEEMAGPSATREREMLKRFGWSQYCPTLYGDFEYGDSNGQIRSVSIMELLEKDLYDLQVDCGGRFSLGTATRLILNCLYSIEQFHSIGFLHCDVKPSNFMIRNNKLFLIDFGMAKRFKSDYGEFLQPTGPAPFCGTVRYASPNAHNYSQHLSMRDDLCSLIYTYYEFLIGTLPWEKYDNNERAAGIMKLQISNSNKLTDPLPLQIVGFLKHVGSLNFYDTPDYKYLANCLIDILKENCIEFNSLYDWEVKDRRELFYWPLN